MATQSSSDVELLTEHFGYPPVSLLDDIINSVNILAERALNSVEQGLLNAPPATLGFRANDTSRSKKKGAQESDNSSQKPEEAARHEIENGTHQLETLLCASIDRNFDKFELYTLRNILCVAPEDRNWIRLGLYQGLDFNKVGDDGPNVESLNALRRKLHASQKLNCMLHAEKTRNERLLSEVRALVGQAGGAGKAETTVKDDPEAAPPPLEFLRNIGGLAEGDAERPLATTTAFSLSQLQALRSLSTSLQEIMPELRNAAYADTSAAAAGPRGGWRRERAEYVEQATRRHLENVRGLELGSQGQVRDGDWQGGGRQLSKDEVESAAKVVTLLGNGREGSPSKKTGD